MSWKKIKTGHYQNINQKSYKITKEGVGLFREGWRPSWRLRKDGEFLGEFRSFRAAKAKAEKVRKLTRMGKKSAYLRYDHKIKYEYQIFLTAFHEAGHMLVERMTSNRRILSATCVPGDGYAGCVVFARLPQKSVDPTTAKGLIMAGLAGPVAETLFTQEVFDLQSLNDVDRAPLMTFGPVLCGGGDLDAYALSLAQETLDLLRNNIESLILLANALFRMDNLNGRQIQGLLRRLNLVPPGATAA